VLKEKSSHVRISPESMQAMESMPDHPAKITPEPNAEGNTHKRTGLAHRYPGGDMIASL
jgi:hypothetical protein